MKLKGQNSTFSQVWLKLHDFSLNLTNRGKNVTQAFYVLLQRLQSILENIQHSCSINFYLFKKLLLNMNT